MRGNLSIDGDANGIAGRAEAQPHRGQRGRVDRPVARPGDVGSTPNRPVEVGLVRADQPVREQVQAQVGVVRVGRRLGERGDHGEHDHGAHAAALVAPGRGGQLGGPSFWPELARARRRRARRRGRGAAPGTRCRARGRRLGDAWRARSPRRPASSVRSSPRTLPAAAPHARMRASSRSRSRSTAPDHVGADRARRCAARSSVARSTAISSRRIAP